jgi:LAO/AO transport system kinase
MSEIDDRAADIPALAAAIRAGDRRSLARAVTLVESSRADHRRDADALIEALLPFSGQAIRLGITGAPGVGKSTFIDAFGMHLIERGHRIAVLAIDPSSARSRGSILGDKTRMPELSQQANAFIRPSPSGASVGGVARRTREDLLLVEAAGFDVVTVETVGVGQSETEVAEMTDIFMLLISPGGGDELQGLKKGIVEHAHVLVVTKADGDLAAAAKRTQADYAAALGILGLRAGAWRPRALACSALERRGIAAVWQTVEECHRSLGPEAVRERRRGQAVRWMWRELDDALRTAFVGDPTVAEALVEAERSVAQGRVAPGRAAEELLRRFRRGDRDPSPP